MAAISTELSALATELESPDWDSFKALTTLYAYRHDRAASTAICHAMERLTDPDLLGSLMQLCHMIVIYDLPELEHLLMDRCQGSMHFSLRMFFLLQAAMEDEVPELVFKTNRLWKQCELAAINAESNSPPRNRVCVENGSFRRRSKLDGASLFVNSPRLSRSASSNSLPTIPSYHTTSDQPPDLFSSTSLIPDKQSRMSPPKSEPANLIDNVDTLIELDPEVSVWNTHNSNNNNRDLDASSGEVSVNSLSSNFESSLQLNTTTTNTSDNTTLNTATNENTPLLSSSDNNLPPSSLSLSSDSTPPPSSLSLSSELANPLESSISVPSYASAVPHASSSSSQQPNNEQNNEQNEKAFGSNFYFRLRQLSGEGKSGKQRVYEYFYTELHMINSLFNISTALMSISLDNIPKLKEVRGRALNLLLTQINTQLIQCEYQSPALISNPSVSGISAISDSSYESFQRDEGLTYGVEIPVVCGWVILKIHPEDSFCLSSRNRIPYMMLIEVLSFEPTNDNIVIPNEPQHQARVHRDESSDHNNNENAEEDWVLLTDDTPTESVLKKGFVEMWSEKEKRIKVTSPFSHLAGWKIAGVIVKSGDDLRQEQLASQMIFMIHGWFRASRLPLYLRPYVVLATSSTTGLIECVPDSCSIDSLKKRIPNFGSLSNYFICAYGHRDSHKFKVAQANFVESLAAYCIICYLLQIKDRHNGNILLDVEGHMIHIDFGFMLNISPGNIGFEQAPFKLNQEMVDLIGGPNSDMFKYFKTLLLSGLLEVRRHARELLLVVEVMSHHSKMACFAKVGGAQVVQALRDRLALDKTEEEILGLVDTLVSNAMRSWTTQSYDSYQYYTNGIL